MLAWLRFADVCRQQPCFRLDNALTFFHWLHGIIPVHLSAELSAAMWSAPSLQDSDEVWNDNRVGGVWRVRCNYNIDTPAEKSCAIQITRLSSRHTSLVFICCIWFKPVRLLYPSLHDVTINCSSYFEIHHLESLLKMGNSTHKLLHHKEIGDKNNN